MLLFLLNQIAFAGINPPDNIVVDLVDGSTVYDLGFVAYEANIDDLNWSDVTTSDDGLASGYTSDLSSAIATLLANQLVETAEPMIMHQALGEKVNDPDYSKQWHMKTMDAEWTWANTSAGDGAIVAVLDTGLTVTKDFNPDTVSPLGKSFTGEPITDLNGHGTHCAGTIAEWTNNGFGGVGLANNAMIMPVKVLSDQGFGSSEWIAAGIYYALDHGANVISMSLGSSQPSSVINKAIDKAIAGGVIVVAAAGNSSSEGSVGWPAKHPPVIAVGSTGPDDLRAYYSSYGEGLDIYAPGGNKKLPGGGVWQYTAPGGVEGLYEFQGTSMATPHLAAAVAVLIAEGAPQEQDKIQEILCATAKKSKFEDKYSCGLVDLRAATTALQRNHSTPSSDNKTPHSPAGSLNLGLLGLSMFLTWRFCTSAGLAKNATKIALAAAALASGPLFALQLFGLDIPALTFLSLHWMEWPEVITPGLSAFPLWLSFLPVTPLYLIGAAFRITRHALIGICTAGATYVGMNAMLGFNTNIYFSFPGITLWYIINSVILVAMVYIATEFDRQRGEMFDK